MHIHGDFHYIDEIAKDVVTGGVLTQDLAISRNDFKKCHSFR